MPREYPLPRLPDVDEVRRRLALLFPPTFADRNILVGRMCAQVVFVFLYGGMVEALGPLFRPSLVYLFTNEQAARVTDEERRAWLASALKPGHRLGGTRWYADNSRESIRDDLIKNRLLSMGIVGRVEGIPTTSSKPVYFLQAAFAQLFDPELAMPSLVAAVESWRRTYLSRSALSRMSLKAKGALARVGDLLVTLPDGARIRVSAGPSAPILKAMVEQFAPRWLGQPVVLWISASDRKSHPQFVDLAATVGLKFDPSNELPDLILADLDEPVRFLFCEIVATDGPVTQARKSALTVIARQSGLDLKNLHFVTAFEDRQAAAFRKTFSRIASGSDVWFSTEPELILQLRTPSSGKTS